MGVNKNFIIKNGLEVGDNLIVANTSNNKVGIGTTNPKYSFEVSGDVAFSGYLYTNLENTFIETLDGTVSASSKNIITGINTTNLRINDSISDFVGTTVSFDTVITSIENNQVTISPEHNRISGSTTIQLNVNRPLSFGEYNQVLVSGGSSSPSRWKSQDSLVIYSSDSSSVLYPTFTTGIGYTALNINESELSFIPSSGYFGIGTIPEYKLDVFGDANVSGNIFISDSLTIGSGDSILIEKDGIIIPSGTTIYSFDDITASTFYGNLVGIASTALDVDIKITYSANKYYPTLVSEDGYTNLNINQDTLHVVPSTNSVGIGTVLARFNVDVVGTIGIDGLIYAPTEQYLYSTKNALIRSISPQIVGIDTTGVKIGDRVYDPVDGYLDPNTIITNVLLGDSVQISPNHNLVSGDRFVDVDLYNTDYITPGVSGSILVSGGSTSPATWRTNFSGTATTALNLADAANITTGTISTERLSGEYDINVSYATTSKDVIGGIGSITNLNVSGISTLGIANATSYYGDGATLVGIVTQIVPGIGVNITATQQPGKGEVLIDAYRPIGKTIFVSQNGNDENTGLAENYPKKTIKSASSSALPGDTIKVFPGVYVEDNPIVLAKTVSVEGTELRNCVITPKNPSLDLFYTNNGCHITDVSFIGPEMTDGASIVSLQPLLGVSADRFFDATKMIRLNLDFIASEAVGFLTSIDYPNGLFELDGGDYTSCKDDIKDIFKAICHDMTRGGNSRCVGAGLSYYSESTLQHIVGVKTETIDTIRYAAGIAHSCINNIEWQGNYQNQFYQVKDLGMQEDSETGSNQDFGSCANVISALYSCVGIVTTIIDEGPSIINVPSGIRVRYPGNSGIGFTTILNVNFASYEETLGKVTLDIPGHPFEKGDIVEIRDLLFECSSGPSVSTQLFPSGKYGYEFYVDKVNSDGTIDVNVGISTIPHNYLSGGIVVNRFINATNAVYDHVTGIATITAPGVVVRPNDFVKLRNFEFSCTSGAGTTTIYPTGNNGYDFKVLSVIGTGTTFTVNVGSSTIPHTYVSGTGLVYPPYSKGVGPITQGPYVRNCTNFVPGSIGMKIDGFAAEPGDKDDIGVTGTMSVDSYTQYNQGGIGVSITNGAYAQLVSIFTICNDIAVFTGSGGQCDITNSNSSFGRLGLAADGVGDSITKSIYRYTGNIGVTTTAEQAIVTISGIGSYRPYDGQVLYFGDLYYRIQRINVTNGGSGYTTQPTISISAPEGENGIAAEAFPVIENGKIISVELVGSGTQYFNPPNISFIGGGGSGASAVAVMDPIYYTIESASLPSAGISTVVLNSNLNSSVSIGTTVYFSRVSLQITSSHSFEWVGSGNDIIKAKPALGGVTIQDNEVVMTNGGLIVYTSTDQAGNFRIGDDVVINQLTGTISGRAFSQSLLTTVTPLIIALGK